MAAHLSPVPSTQWRGREWLHDRANLVDNQRALCNPDVVESACNEHGRFFVVLKFVSRLLLSKYAMEFNLSAPCMMFHRKAIKLMQSQGTLTIWSASHLA